MVGKGWYLEFPPSNCSDQEVEGLRERVFLLLLHSHIIEGHSHHFYGKLW